MDKLTMRKTAAESSSFPRESFEFLELGMAQLRVSRRRVYLSCGILFMDKGHV